ncbi:hypothetical protein VP01_1900g1 [Puccinia sorghi]|uniref:Uncharacterized protein n=1 Tax=Puccinia sorghi TaxID=27349 RepID=A0A0L6VDD9_9BASI|nr:hypothetical protein VP01_1900g1 [Puccinia sorghi]
MVLEIIIINRSRLTLLLYQPKRRSKVTLKLPAVVRGQTHTHKIEALGASCNSSYKKIYPIKQSKKFAYHTRFGLYLKKKRKKPRINIGGLCLPQSAARPPYRSGGPMWGAVGGVLDHPSAQSVSRCTHTPAFWGSHSTVKFHKLSPGGSWPTSDQMGSRIEDRLLEILNVKTAGGEPSSVDKIWGVEAHHQMTDHVQVTCANNDKNKNHARFKGVGEKHFLKRNCMLKLIKLVGGFSMDCVSGKDGPGTTSTGCYSGASFRSGIGGSLNGKTLLEYQEIFQDGEKKMKPFSLCCRNKSILLPLCGGQSMTPFQKKTLGKGELELSKSRIKMSNSCVTGKIMGIQKCLIWLLHTHQEICLITNPLIFKLVTLQILFQLHLSKHFEINIKKKHKTDDKNQICTEEMDQNEEKQEVRASSSLDLFKPDLTQGGNGTLTRHSEQLENDSWMSPCGLCGAALLDLITQVRIVEGTHVSVGHHCMSSHRPYWINNKKIPSAPQFSKIINTVSRCCLLLCVTMCSFVFLLGQGLYTMKKVIIISSNS